MAVATVAVVKAVEEKAAVAAKVAVKVVAKAKAGKVEKVVAASVAVVWAAAV